MSFDVIDLRQFYNTPLGQFAARMIRQEVDELWPSAHNDVVGVIGYGLPFFGAWQEGAECVINMMPESQGVSYWPEEGANSSCLVKTDELPFEDESFNRLFIVHALETSKDSSALLQEAWRVLQPQGQLIITVPHRRGAWAHSDETPFGTGEPYSRAQLHGILNEHGFSVENISRCLIAPPRKSRLALMMAPYIERLGSCFFDRFGGVLTIQAMKQVYTPAYVKSRSVRRRLVLPMPVPASPVPTGRGHLAFDAKSCKVEPSK